jgi:2-polyprenyl-3-methyl-5-hydroxy-6-metoxy-1,4-benzoquinol methylase
MKRETADKILSLNKKSYDNIAEHFSITRNYIWPDLKNLSEHVLNDYSVLDVGCGNGRLYEELESKNVKYFGVDSCKKLIDIARDRYKKNSHNAQFGVFNIFNMPFNKNQFNIIFAVAVINHIPTRKLQLKALKKLSKIIKPGGLLLMTNWNLLRPTLNKKSVLYYGLKKLKTSKKDWLEKYQVDKKELKLKDVMTEWKSKETLNPLYYYAFSLKELDDLVKESGFEILDSYYSKKGKKVNWSKGNNLVTIARKI